VVVVVVRDLVAIDWRNAFTCNDVTSQKVTYMNPKSSHQYNKRRPQNKLGLAVNAFEL